jgi:hypothetical protein
MAQNELIRDEDGTFLGGNGGSIISRAEVFSSNSFFGIQYSDPINRPANQSFWCVLVKFGVSVCCCRVRFCPKVVLHVIFAMHTSGTDILLL